MSRDHLEKCLKRAYKSRSEKNMNDLMEAYYKYALEGGSVFVGMLDGRIVAREMELIPGYHVAIVFTSSSYIPSGIVTSVIPLEDLMVLVASVDDVNGILFNQGSEEFAFMDERICELYLTEVEKHRDMRELALRIVERYRLMVIDQEPDGGSEV